MRDVLCWRDQRYVGAQLSFSYERRKIMLEVNEVTRGLVGKYVDTYVFPDGRFQVRWNGLPLPYTVFDKDQRVTHAAITENKHLGAVLAYIKDQQGHPAAAEAEAGRQTANPLPADGPAQRRLECEAGEPRQDQSGNDGSAACGIAAKAPEPRLALRRDPREG